jgi:photosystem II stability/assembly factor-like uncharacterized protein
MTVEHDREEAVIREMLRAALEPPAPGLADRVLVAVRERADSRQEPRSHWSFGLVATALACALVGTLAIGMRAARQATPTSATNRSAAAALAGPVGAAPIGGLAAGVFTTSAAGLWLARETASGGSANRTTLYQTADDGRTWVTRLTYDGGVPSQVVFDGSGNGVVVGGQRDEAAADLVLFLTRDGGVTWQRASPPLSGVAWGVPYFVDAQQGWVLASLGPGRAEVLSTIDAGRTWTEAAPFNDRANFPGLSSVKLRILWAKDGRAIVVPPLGSSAMPAHVFITEDGGATWRASFFASPPGEQVTTANGLLDARLRFDDRGVLFLQPLGASGRGTGLFAYTTADAGRSWGQPIRVEGPMAASPPLFALDGGHWWASSGGGGDLVSTDDGGRTLRRHTGVLPPGSAFESLTFTSAADGWAVAVANGGRAAFATHDGGAHWQPVTPP